MPITRLSELAVRAKEGGLRRIAVAWAQDENVLLGVDEAYKAGIASSYLVGDRAEIERLASDLHIDLGVHEIVNETDPVLAAKAAVNLASSGNADFVLKGAVPTAVMLQAALDKEIGLRSGRLLSSVMIYEVPGVDRLLFLADGGMIIAPTIEQKVEIINNTVEVARALGIDVPKVACLAAIEHVNPDMPATMDAAVLSMMCQRGQIKGCAVDGPLALDVAISQAAAREKHVNGPVAGSADILLVPDIEAGNLLGKSMSWFSHAKSAGLIVGTTKPVIVVSRSDSAETKFLSIALACVVSGERGKSQ